jgi:catechol 2,3-dioxygenase-like lactoylglutathione lyase family enzyme
MPDADKNDVVAAGPIAGIDHALIGVADLDRARDSFLRLGFTVSPRGRHVGWGTGNYTIMFEHDYVELLGVIDPTQYIHGLDAFLESGEGLLNVAMGTDDAEEAFRWLQSQGIDAPPPENLQRLLETEEGNETLQFRNIHLPDELTPGLKTFACQHLTPEKLRRASWLSHPNGARGISEVTIVMEDLEGVREAYSRLFGEAAVTGDARKGNLTVDTGQDELWFVTPKAFPERHYDKTIDESLPLPRLAALTLSVADTQVTALYLSGQQVAFERDSTDAVIVSYEEACGTFLVFADGDSD